MEQSIILTSPAFCEGGSIPWRHTGFGDDLSPELHIENISPDALTLALTMDDLDIPMVGEFNHWLLWNVPPVSVIPEGLPGGVLPKSLSGAIRGTAWRGNRYAGPKQPFFIRSSHRYRFTVYALDTLLCLPASAKKPELLATMEGHVLQTGTLTGLYRRVSREVRRQA